MWFDFFCSVHQATRYFGGPKKLKLTHLCGGRFDEQRLANKEQAIVKAAKTSIFTENDQKMSEVDLVIGDMNSDRLGRNVKFLKHMGWIDANIDIWNNSVSKHPTAAAGSHSWLVWLVRLARFAMAWSAMAGTP